MPVLQQFPLPDAGEGLTEAEIVEWHVAVGEAVAVNQVLVEIETAKSLVELPSPWAGVVTALLVEPGATVPVGTPIVEIDTDPHGAAPVPAPAPASAVAAPGPSSAAGEGPASSRTSSGVAEVRDDAGAGEAVLVGYGTSAAATARRRIGAPVAPSSAAASPRGSSGSSGAATAGKSGHALAKPPVRKLARDLGLDLDAVAGTGPGGIVTREDVLDVAARGQAKELATYADDDTQWLTSGTVSADGRQTRVPVRSVRKRTAEAMVTSAFTAPHVTVFHTVDVTRTMKLVEKLRADREFADVRVTPLLIAAKALLLAVRRHPEINASWDEDAQEIVYKHYVNLGIAAATPRGLIVPNIKDAHRLGLLGLARGLADLTANARSGKTTPADNADGTITITNVGVFGIDTGTPILNPGEAAILAFGAIRLQPWVHKGKIKQRYVTQLALSFDHRLVDGELGSRLLADVAAVLQDPAHGLVWG
ncbi:MAG TPA: dihydrolipoamide acetyltransferase family protein [Cellulomonas sp.]